MTTGVISCGMSSMTRVRLRLQRCSSPPQQGQAARRCSTRASIFSGVLRREPGWPLRAPGLLRRLLASGFWWIGTMPEGVAGEGACAACN